jgi:glucokinase
MMKYVGVDIGGTQLRIGLVDETNTLLEFFSTPVPEDYSHGLNQIIDRVSQFTDVQGIGVGLPGLVGKDFLIAANNLPSWVEKPLRKDLSDGLNLPVTLTHDVAAAVVGEAIFQPKSELPLTFFIWGTGVGGCQVQELDGKYFLQSFEVGHHVIVPRGKLCNCGLHGCAEAYIGGKSLLEQYPDIITRSDNDPIWEAIAEYAAQTFSNAFAFYPTKRAIFGGGVIQHRPFLLDMLKAKFQEEQPDFLTMPELQISTLEDKAGVYGTAASCWVKKL